MNIPEDLRYTKTHEWVRVEDGRAYVGITDFAQEHLGDIVYVELPEVGSEVEAGDAFVRSNLSRRPPMYIRPFRAK